MDRCIQLSYLYHDVDIVELKVSAWNGIFGGSTSLYIGKGELASMATLLAGFPVGLRDRREITFGASGPETAGGATNLTLSCIDGAGHCQMHVMIEADYSLRDSLAERVEMLCAFEPAALDEFASQMRRLNSSLTGSAVLALLES
jgi:hypothetical protein